ncbi:serine protease HtrA [Halarchaeum acidiphilum MH1-52-1]|uniref:Serine protease HtrA n=1 Tax=Halarchaeum acidiphilum MH1-52-1 TaxID=1261545 RepID=U2YER5_9EURY|nr:trypsin-like peptidase domain-containing protein [Halarchaeum acidiphilum]GAD52321.1 serine protease HtrA [Halarchaeum acidiphilum MH1-52-1]
MSRSRPAVALGVVVLVALAGCAGLSFTGPTGSTTSTGATAANGTTTAAPAAPTSASASGAYASLYDRTIDSVVMIRVVTPTEVATGSGFVYDDRGDIVTNHHVIANARSVEVRFANGTWENASVVGSDAYSDLAVVRVPDRPANATALPLASSAPRPGESVAAIGNPYGLTGSITTGVVSGVNRSMSTSDSFTIPGTVQTDAAINPGNSGGPLLTPNGTVVGVNRATEGDNVGFAISAAVVSHVVPNLLANGSYTHAYLGVSTTDVTPAIARANGLSNASGVAVVRTLAGGPSDGVLHGSTGYATVDGQRVPTGGDVIVAIDGTPVQTGEALSRSLLLHAHPNETVPTTVVRNGTRTTANVTLGTRPSPSAATGA